MAWVRFTRGWEHSPRHGVTQVFGERDYNVPRGTAEKAISAGAAIRLTKAARDKTPVTLEDGHDAKSSRDGDLSPVHRD